jgi:hypothetical protein
MRPQPRLQLRTPPLLPPRLLSGAGWLSSKDACELFQHAVPLLSRHYLTLVLCELAERAHPHWTKFHSEDWRPAWCLATARAWCFGEATVHEVHAARVAGIAALKRWNPRARQEGTSSAAAYSAAKACVLATAYVWEHGDGPLSPDAAESCAFWAAAAHSADEEKAVQAFFSEGADIPAAAVFAREADEAAEEVKEKLHDARLAEVASHIRELVPYPSVLSRRWEPKERTAVAGHALLELEGWRIVGARKKREQGKGRWN